MFQMLHTNVLYVPNLPDVPYVPKVLYVPNVPYVTNDRIVAIVANVFTKVYK